MIKKYTLKNGEIRYLYHTYLGIDPITNKKVYKKKQGFKSKKAAEIAENRLIYEFDQNGFPSERKDSSFNEVYNLWLESEYMDNVKESTLQKTTRLFKNHIIPSFDGMIMDKIQPSYCQKELNKWRDKLVNFSAVKNYSNRVFDYALRMEIIDKNPLDRVTMPQRLETIEESEFDNFYTKEELNDFLKFVKEDLSFQWYAYFHILAYSGARKSEILALTWKDINFDDKSVNIGKTLTRGLNNRLIVQPTKTINGRRKIDMDNESIAILKRWKMQQAQSMLKLGFNTSSHDQLVFPNTKNKFMVIDKPNQRMKNVQKRHGLREITVHGLRHTHCSLLFSAGATIKEVQARLGHTDIQTTMNIYAHVSKEDKKETAHLFANYMNK